MKTGVIPLGALAQPLRDGSRLVVLCWEAELLPARVCEGGGWYSAHPTERHWHVRYWLRHKRRPGWDWPSVAAFGDCADLDDMLAKIEARERKRYGFPAQGTEARRAETGTGSVHDGPVGEADAPSPSPSHTGD